jgi:hypothetical protein
MSFTNPKDEIEALRLANAEMRQTIRRLRAIIGKMHGLRSMPASGVPEDFDEEGDLRRYLRGLN